MVHTSHSAARHWAISSPCRQWVNPQPRRASGLMLTSARPGFARSLIPSVLLFTAGLLHFCSTAEGQTPLGSAESISLENEGPRSKGDHLKGDWMTSVGYLRLSFASGCCRIPHITPPSLAVPTKISLPHAPLWRSHGQHPMRWVTPKGQYQFV